MRTINEDNFYIENKDKITKDILFYSPDINNKDKNENMKFFIKELKGMFDNTIDIIYFDNLEEFKQRVNHYNNIIIHINNITDINKILKNLDLFNKNIYYLFYYCYFNNEIKALIEKFTFKYMVNTNNYINFYSSYDFIYANRSNYEYMVMKNVMI